MPIVLTATAQRGATYTSVRPDLRPRQDNGLPILTLSDADELVTEARRLLSMPRTCGEAELNDAELSCTEGANALAALARAASFPARDALAAAADELAACACRLDTLRRRRTAARLALIDRRAGAYQPALPFPIG